MRNLIQYMVFDIMSQEKKSKKTDIDRLRDILDKPHDPKIKKSVSKENKHLESILNRLIDEQKREIPSSPGFIPKEIGGLEPRVAIYKKEEEKLTPPSALPEFTEVESQQEPIGKEAIPFEEEHFDDVELFEIEKVKISEPEFVEVKPKEKKEKPVEETKEVLPTPVFKEEPKEEPVEEELPEWEPIGEPQIKEQKTDETDKEIKVTSEESKIEIPEEPEIKTTKEEALPTFEPVEEEIKEEPTVPFEAIEEPIPKEEKPAIPVQIEQKKSKKKQKTEEKQQQKEQYEREQEEKKLAKLEQQKKNSKKKNYSKNKKKNKKENDWKKKRQKK